MLILIDGNNLLHAAHGELEEYDLGRVRLCDRLGRWAAPTAHQVFVVFDGPDPPTGIQQQMRAAGLEVRFSGPRSADELIEETIEQSQSPGRLWVVTSDRAIQSVARHRRCRCTSSADFLIHLTTPDPKPEPKTPPAPTPGDERSRENADHWLRTFGYDPAEPADDTDLMT
ncbi:MAG: NYN domain-containing protein [Planctomycetes bacterium]|nr:NYN domain-containing protein [Planctomycetota bacterium]